MWALLPGALAALCIYGWWRVVRFKRTIENVPTSKVKGVFLGMNEVKGEADCDAPLTTYLAETPAVWFTYAIEEHWRRTVTERDSQGKTRTRTESGWKTVDSGGDQTLFDLRDETGAILVDPTGAKIEAPTVFSESCGRSDWLYYGKGPERGISNSTGKRRFSEQALRPGDRLYVLGSAQIRDDIVAPMIAEDARDPYYLISTRTEKQIVRGSVWSAFFLVLGGALCSVATPVVLYMHRHGLDVGQALRWQPEMLLAAGGIFLAVCGLAYLQLLYNGLVRTRHRLERALSLIDVQLKRRHDLIPSLVTTVKGVTGHEREVQESVASLRNLGPDELGTKRLIAVREAYPDLKTHDAFAKLFSEITDTEDRIACAREFYNDSLKVLKDRLQTFPDVLVAKLFAFKPGRELPPLRDFERDHPGVS